MESTKVDSATATNDEVSLKDVVLKFNKIIKHLLSKWVIILLFALVGAGLGLAYSIIKKPQYTALCTFVLDDGAKTSSISQYAGLAALAGIDVGGSGGGGIFQGDNILELYKSRSMIEKTLLSEVQFNNKKQLLIDRYIEFNKLRDKWGPNAQNVSFNGDQSKFNRTQDSIITDLVVAFNKRALTVTKPDKKLNIISVQVVSNDELFAKEFTEKLVETVNNFYIQTKTGKAQKSVQIFQHEADSVRGVLNSSLSGAASSIDATPNANPGMQILKVPTQKKQIDVQSRSAIYSEIVKNLEVSKMSLLQETPLIQVLDKPVLPLEKEKMGRLKAIVIGGFIAAFLAIAGVLITGLFKQIMP